MKKIITLILAMAMIFAFAGCQSEDATTAQKVIFGTNAEFPPFEYVTANGVLGEYDGIDMAIVKQIGEDMGAEIVIENMEFDSLIMALANGQIDASISGMTITEERKETVDFSVPYYKATQVMIVKEDSDIKKHLIWKAKKSLQSRATQAKSAFRKWATNMKHSKKVQKL
jgi:polar amino acid transport system substrate-binding protein